MPDDKKGDQTAVRGIPAPLLPRSGPVDDTSTGVAKGAPVLPNLNKAKQPPPDPSADASPEIHEADTADQTDEGGDETIILRIDQRKLFEIARLSPKEHRDVILLNGWSYAIGRSSKSDIALFSKTASREHAELVRRGDAWFLVPVADKVLTVDGVVVRDEIELSHGMRIQAGEDELEFRDKRVALAEPDAVAPTAAANGSPWLWWVLGVGSVLFLLLFLIWQWGV